MVTRVALFAASLAASAVLAVGLALAGFAPTAPATPDATATPAAAPADPAPITQIDTVYVVPAPTPQATPPTIVIQRVVITHGGDDGGDQGGD